MAVVIAVPVLIVLVGTLVVWRIRSRRGDEKSIEAHRSALGVIEHVSVAEAELAATTDRARAHGRTQSHVRIIGQPPGTRPEPSRDDAVVPGYIPRRTDRLSFPLPRDRSLRPPTVEPAATAEPEPAATTEPEPAARPKRPKESPVAVPAPANPFDLSFPAPAGA